MENDFAPGQVLKIGQLVACGQEMDALVGRAQQTTAKRLGLNVSAVYQHIDGCENGGAMRHLLNLSEGVSREDQNAERSLAQEGDQIGESLRLLERFAAGNGYTFDTIDVGKLPRHGFGVHLVPPGRIVRRGVEAAGAPESTPLKPHHSPPARAVGQACRFEGVQTQIHNDARS